MSLGIILATVALPIRRMPAVAARASSPAWGRQTRGMRYKPQILLPSGSRR